MRSRQINGVPRPNRVSFLLDDCSQRLMACLQRRTILCVFRDNGGKRLSFHSRVNHKAHVFGKGRTLYQVHGNTRPAPVRRDQQHGVHSLAKQQISPHGDLQRITEIHTERRRSLRWLTWKCPLDVDPRHFDGHGMYVQAVHEACDDIALPYGRQRSDARRGQDPACGVIQERSRSASGVENADAIHVACSSRLHRVFDPFVVEHFLDHEGRQPIRRVELSEHLAVAFRHIAVVEVAENIATASAPIVAVHQFPHPLRPCFAPAEVQHP